VNTLNVKNHIIGWLASYLETSSLDGFIIGISGGIDSACTAMLCAETGKKVLLITMPIRQTKSEFDRAKEQMEMMALRFPNVSIMEISLTNIFEAIENNFPKQTTDDHLSMANTRARLRMLTLYAIGQTNRCLVVGTGNKIEDFGVGFYTKYGDGGVDISPIADLMKSEVFDLAKELGVVASIQNAKPTDGLWEDGRSDEDQIGASYPDLEWAMEFTGDVSELSIHQKNVLSIYKKLNKINAHKMIPIPVCIVPLSVKQ
jgi:NAD+ synthase